MAFDDFVDELLDDENLNEYVLAELVKAYALNLNDIESHLTNPDENYRYAALCALGIVCHRNDFKSNLRLLRLAASDMSSFMVNGALEWAMWNVLPDWWEDMTRGLNAFSALCAWLAFLKGMPVDEAFTVKHHKTHDRFKYRILLYGIEVLAFESSERPVSQTAPIQLALF